MELKEALSSTGYEELQIFQNVHGIATKHSTTLFQGKIE